MAYDTACLAHLCTNTTLVRVKDSTDLDEWLDMAVLSLYCFAWLKPFISLLNETRDSRASYLTYKLVSNATYNENAYIDFCASVGDCCMIPFKLSPTCSTIEEHCPTSCSSKNPVLNVPSSLTFTLLSGGTNCGVEQ